MRRPPSPWDQTPNGSADYWKWRTRRAEALAFVAAMAAFIIGAAVAAVIVLRTCP